MIDMYMLLFPFLLSAVFSLNNYFRSRHEKSHIPKDHRPLYPPRYSFFMVNYLCVLYVNLYLIHLYRAEDTFSLALVLILTLTGGLGLLLILLPVLRKILSSESCAILWTIPCLLPILAGHSPRWCISLPFSPPSRRTIHTLVWIWFAGFAAVMLWSILTHLLFRRRLLKNAKPVEDETYQQVWRKQLKIANFPTDLIRLRIAPDTQTPLSIGLFWRTTCLVLPERTYSPEKLEMVLKHELIHISRRDSILKFSMTFWAAFMWFNPFAWIALRVCSQDLELSCDEAVVYGHSEQSRMEYARLLLHTAPKQQGFTSCLSASASTLRYRLKNVVTYRKRITGSIAIGFLCFFMLLGGMCTGIRYQAMPANELLFTEYEANQLEVGEMFYQTDGADISGECEKDQILLDYIATLSLQKTTETPDAQSTPSHVQVIIHAPDHNYILTFGNGYLRVVTVTFSESDSDHSLWKTAYYRMDSDPDWKLLLSCITPFV